MKFGRLLSRPVRRLWKPDGTPWLVLRLNKVVAIFLEDHDGYERAWRVAAGLQDLAQARSRFQEWFH